MPGNLSPTAVIKDAATEVTVEPTAATAIADETTEMTPRGLVANVKACRVKVPLAVFEAILQPPPAVRTREWAVFAAMLLDAIVHVIVVKPSVPVAGGHAATGAMSSVVQTPVTPAFMV